MFDLTYYNDICKIVSLHKEQVKMVNNATQKRTLIPEEGINSYLQFEELEELVNKHPEYMHWYLNTYTTKNRLNRISMFPDKEVSICRKDKRIIHKYPSQ